VVRDGLGRCQLGREVADRLGAGLAVDPRLCLADGCLPCLREGMSPAAVALARY